MRKHLAAGLAVLACVHLAGCSSLINPHARVDFSDIRSNAQESNTQAPRSGPATVAEGTDYADAAITAYRDAIDDQATLTSLLGFGLIPLSAAALGVGATGGSSAILLGMGLAGASALGVGTWLINDKEQLIYVAGIKALICARDMAVPMNLPIIGDGRLEAYLYEANDTASALQALPSLAVAIVRVRAALENAKQAEAAAGEVSEKAEVDAQYAATDAALKRATNALDEGAKLLTAGESLRTAVDLIINDVDKAIIEAQPRLESLPTVVGGIAQLAGKFGAQGLGGAAAKAPPIAGSQSDDPTNPKRILRESLDALEVAVGILNRSTERVASILTVVGSGQLAALKRCGLDVNSIPLDLTLNPAGPLAFAEKRARTQLIRITGGTLPLAAALLEGATEGIAVSLPEPLSRYLLIQTTDKLAAGTYHVTVVDAAGHDATLQIDVKAAQQGAGSTGSTEGPATASNCLAAANLVSFDNLGANKISDIRTRLRTINPTLAEGEAMGTDLRAAIAAFQKTNGLPETGCLDGTTIGKVSAL